MVWSGGGEITPGPTAGSRLLSLLCIRVIIRENAVSGIIARQRSERHPWGEGRHPGTSLPPCLLATHSYLLRLVSVRVRALTVSIATPPRCRGGSPAWKETLTMCAISLVKENMVLGIEAAVGPKSCICTAHVFRATPACGDATSQQQTKERAPCVEHYDPRPRVGFPSPHQRFCKTSRCSSSAAHISLSACRPASARSPLWNVDLPRVLKGRPRSPLSLTLR